MMKRLWAASLVLAFAGEADAIPSFRVEVSSDSAVGYGTPPMNIVAPAPVSRMGADIVSGVNGSTGNTWIASREWNAFAGPGALGVRSRSSANGDVPAGIDQTVRAEFRVSDFVISSSGSDPLADATINLDFSGDTSVFIGAPLFVNFNETMAVAWIRVTVSLFDADYRELVTGRFIESVNVFNGPGFNAEDLLSSLTPTDGDVDLAAVFTNVPVNTELNLEVSLEAYTDAESVTPYNAIAISDYDNTLTLSTSGPVVTSSDASFITANSGQLGLVDNTYVPAPATSIFGVAGIVASRRRRP